MLAALEAQAGQLAHARLEPDVAADQHQHDQDDRVEGAARQHRGHERAARRPDEGGEHQRQERPRVGADAPDVRRRADRGAAEGRELVGGRDLHDRRARQADEQGGELDQPAATDDGVDEAGDQGREDEEEDDLEGQVSHAGRLSARAGVSGELLHDDGVVVLGHRGAQPGADQLLRLVLGHLRGRAVERGERRRRRPRRPSGRSRRAPRRRCS